MIQPFIMRWIFLMKQNISAFSVISKQWKDMYFKSFHMEDKDQFISPTHIPIIFSFFLCIFHDIHTFSVSLKISKIHQNHDALTGIYWWNLSDNTRGLSWESISSPALTPQLTYHDGSQTQTGETSVSKENFDRCLETALWMDILMA